jgi:hypothetical protein
MVPLHPSSVEQARALRPLARFFELEGWTATTESTGALCCQEPRPITIGIYPALLASAAAEATHPTTTHREASRVILPDYLVEHDLPSAYQRATGLNTASSGAKPQRTASPLPKGRAVELPVKDLRKANQVGVHGKVRVMTDIEIGTGAFAVRVPNPGLTSAGFNAGAWIIVRSVSLENRGPDTWMVVLRTRGRFSATGADWTIAHVKELGNTDSGPARVQLSYGSATGKEFRPERLERDEITIAATVVCHTDEAS